MADVIWSVTNHVGLHRGSGRSRRASHGAVKAYETGQRLSVRARRQGQPDGGLGIRVAWTRDDGTVATKTLWTDAAGPRGRARSASRRSCASAR